MANQEHLEILKQGVEVWNKWRKKNKEIKPDLSGANLNNRQLNGANFENTDFELTYLNGVNLSDANLSFADLYKAKISNANLSRAKLSSAMMERTTFHQSNFDGASFISATFDGTSLDEADLRGATFLNTKLIDLDLRSVRGLEEIFHTVSSFISTSTFMNSRGEIPEIFLKGCGLRDWEIESVKLYQPKLTPTQITDILYKMDELRNESPIQLHNLFISYSHQDAEFVNRLEKHLEAKRIRFWRDVHNAPAGPLEKIVVRAIEQNQTVLLIFSKNSINSDWVEFEITKARELEKKLGRHVICPIALDDSWKEADWSGIVMNQVRKYNILDFSKWKEEKVLGSQFDKLVKGLDLFYKE